MHDNKSPDKSRRVREVTHLVPNVEVYEQALQTAAGLLEQLSDEQAVAFIIEDNSVKLKHLKSLLPKSMLTVESRSAVEGIALFEALHELDVPGDKDLPPVFIFLDGTFPASPGEDPENGMGMRTAEEIVDYYQAYDLPAPNFVGFSTDMEPNEELRMLLESRGVGESYMGDYNIRPNATLLKIGARAVEAAHSGEQF